MRLCVLQTAGSTFCLHAPMFPESKEDRRKVQDSLGAGIGGPGLQRRQVADITGE